MMDISEIWRLHELYNDAPTVGVLDPVLFKHRQRNIWNLAFVHPPERINWKPGDPVGKKLDLMVIGHSQHPRLETGVPHIGDPLYIYDTQNVRSCWQSIGVKESAATVIELMSMVTKLQSELTVFQEISRTHGEVLSRLSARIENPKSTRGPAKPQPLAEAAA